MRRWSMSLVCAGVCAALALLGVPRTAHSTIQAPEGWIYIVGQQTPHGEVDPVGQKDLFECDHGPMGCLPTSGEVMLDFSECPDITISAQHDYPGLIYRSCTQVAAMTDANHYAHFRLVGHTQRTGCSPSPGVVKQYYRGVLHRTFQVACFDQDGGGVGASDLSLILADLGCGVYRSRSDFDGSGNLGPNDLSIFLGVYFGNGSNSGDIRLCP